jgi:ubiquinone/menaquinone biosynthesis C-methylase UbiE
MHANPPDDFVRHIIQSYSRDCDVTVDVGCGPAAYKHCFRGKYIGLDFTPDEYHPGMPRAVDLIGHAEDIPLDDASVDMVFSKSAFFLANDHRAALAEFWRVLRPGGRVLIMDYNRRTQRRIQAHPNTPQSLKIDTRLPCWTQWGLRSLVRSCGYQQVEIVAPARRHVSGAEYWLRLLYTEIAGTYAIVTAVRP